MNLCAWRRPWNNRQRQHDGRLLRIERLEDRAVPAGLVAAYSFDEGTGAAVGDSSGNFNVGTISNAVWADPGRFGQALLFNGINSWVTVNDSNSLDLTTGMTIEAWVRPTVFDAWEAVVVKERPEGTTYGLYAASPGGSPPGSFITFAGLTSGVSTLGTQALPLFAWTHLAMTFDGTTSRLYVNGDLKSSQVAAGSIATSSNALRIGGNGVWGEHFAGLIDEVRIYDHALSGAEILADMNTPLGEPSTDFEPPTVAVQTTGDPLAHVAILSATAADNVGVANVEYFVDGNFIGFASSAPYRVPWDTTSASNGPHAITAIARDVSGNQTTSIPVNVNVLNPGFADEVVVPGIPDATTIAFLPDGRMLVGKLTNKVLLVHPGASEPDPQPLLDLDYAYQVGEQGLIDIAVDPAFSQNGYIYIYYTKGFPGSENLNRLSRFTLSGNAVVPDSEFVLWEDDLVAGGYHHGGAIAFGNDGKIYFTTGEGNASSSVQQLNNYRGKVLRINQDGSTPLDNPFYDGAGPNKDAIWAYGLRNPFRISIDPPTGRMYIGDVGGNDWSAAIEELNLGIAGANYGWPLEEGNGSLPGMTDPIFSYPHNFRDAAITGGFVYRGNQFPSEYQGSYFFADYAQNTIRRLIFDPQGNVANVVNFLPASGSTDQLVPGDVAKLVEGPDGCLYYVDIGFDALASPNSAAIRRIRYVAGNQPPVVVADANPTTGSSPLEVSFSSAGSLDPEGLPLSYLWSFGDGMTSTDPNPTHLYTASGSYAATLRVSDSVSFPLSETINVTIGTPPSPTILGPANGSTFRAGDVIAFSATATDPDDETLPASAYSWEIRFLHEGHVHPAGVFSDTQSGLLTIPTSGHDYQGNTRYEIVLFVTDSTGLTASTSVIVYPEKVDLSFDSVPSGLAVQIDGINRQTPFVLDSLIGFHNTIAAPDQVSGGAVYRFLGWSDGGTQSHQLIVPSSNQSYVATFVVAPVTLPGDYNANQVVDAADYVVWRKQLGGTAILPNDTTPGSVTAEDGNVWRAHFGESEAPQGLQMATLTVAATRPEQVAGLATDEMVSNGHRRQLIRSIGSRDGILSRSSRNSLLLVTCTTSLEDVYSETTEFATDADTDEQANAANCSRFRSLDSIFAEIGNTWSRRPRVR